ncbi:phosphoribosyl-ATP diphosphatase [Candidatus Saccharibacteria bacterium]|nr:phosphoribosyl-ATP diphosphatase [Candidatus Saccharibacteria bacterium]
MGNVALQYVRDEEGLRLLNDGQRDLAFIGSDKFAELSLSGTIKSANVIDSVPIDCSMILAGPDDEGISQVQMKLGKPMKVATSYPFLMNKMVSSSFVDLQPTFVSGGCEGYVSSGLCDLLFDIKATGDTIAANGLKIYLESRKLDLKVLDYCEYDQRSAGDKLYDGLLDVASVLSMRRNDIESMDATSYTLGLMRSQNALVKKLSEEFGELLQALLRSDTNKQEVISEAADLLYAIQVWMTLKGVSLIDVIKEDIRRSKA